MLPENLLDIAVSLERQFQLLKTPGCKVPLEEWDSIPSKMGDLIPGWCKELLAGYALAGPVIERPHESWEWNRYFSFWLPATYADRMTRRDPFIDDILKEGYVPLSDESDGDIWVTPLAGNATSPVYLADLSGWEIRPMSENMAVFLTECKISEEYLH